MPACRVNVPYTKNSPLKITHNNSIRVALLLIQGLQAELYSLRLRDNGLYVLEKLKSFRFPKKTTFLSDINEFVDGMSILRSLCVNSIDLYNEALLERKKMQDYSSESPCCTDCRLPWARELVMPPASKDTE